MMTSITMNQIIALQKEIVRGCANALPEEVNEYIAYVTRALAENLVKRDTLATERAELDVRLAAALEEGKVNAWKRKGLEKKETASVQTINKEIAANDARLSALILEANAPQKAFDTFCGWEKENADMAAWSAGGSEPEHVRRREEKDLAHLRAGCVTIRVDPTHSVWKTTEPTETETWVGMSASSYLDTLMPKKVEVEEVVVTPIYRSGGTPNWMLNFRKK